MEPTTTARRLIVHGLVQGVGFRWSCKRVADELGITGWARNRDDGTVEVLAEGTVPAVDAMLDWCRRGPRHAQVTRLEVAVIAPLGRTGFSVG